MHVYLVSSSLCHICYLFFSLQAGHVKFLIDSKKRLLAIKFICVFKLESSFPLVPLLEDHLEFLKKRVNETQKDGTFESKVCHIFVAILFISLLFE